MDKILERLKSLGYTLVGFYDSQNGTNQFPFVVMGCSDKPNELGQCKYAVWYGNHRGIMHAGSYYGPGAGAHHDALNEFCDRCHKLHP